MAEQIVQLPNDWRPRGYQRKVWDYLEAGGKRAVCVWHRRSGKDNFAVNYTATAAMQRVGLYWHCLPELAHARRVIWNAIDLDGRRVVDQSFPAAIRESMNDNEMRIKLINGSIWQCVGSDNVDSLMGCNPLGIIFSEHAIGDPRAWNMMRPILSNNGGWCVFISTPRGQNHLYDLFEMAKQTPGWFAELLDVDATGATSLAAIEADRRSGMPEAEIRQEYYCSFAGAISGSYYADAIELAQQEGRITNVAYDPSLPVHTAWDLGISDETSIWCFQRHRQEIRLVDFIEGSGAGLEFYTRELDRKPFTYGDHFLPHDVKVRELGTGRSRLSMLKSLGLTARIVPKLPIEDGISAVRSILGRCWFDAKNCERGLKALRSYRVEYDDKRQCFKNSPLHDWSSNGADAFRYLALSIERVDRMARRESSPLLVERSDGRVFAL